jgi:hypothetical protein
MFGCEYKSWYIQAEIKGLPWTKEMETHILTCEECQEELEEIEENKRLWKD